MMIRRIIFALILVGMFPSLGAATPDPMLKIRDDMLVVHDGSYVVLRQQTHYPGSYYQYRQEIALVRLSLWTNKVQANCILKTEHWATDAAKNDGVWVADVMTDPDCIGQLPSDLMEGEIMRDAKLPKIIGRVLPQDYVSQRLSAAMGELAVGELAVGRGVDGCKFQITVTQPGGRGWNFAQLSCGHEDTDQVQIYVPISDKTWTKIMTELGGAAK